MLWSWFEIGFGLLIIMVVLGRPVKLSKEKDTITNDEIILNKARQELNNYDYYEIESIESLDKKTTVIANTGFLEIVIDIDKKLEKHSTKKKLIENDIILNYLVICVMNLNQDEIF